MLRLITFLSHAVPVLCAYCAGNSVSTFSALAVLQRRHRGSWAAFYNGGNTPLTTLMGGESSIYSRVLTIRAPLFWHRPFFGQHGNYEGRSWSLPRQMAAYAEQPHLQLLFFVLKALPVCLHAVMHTIRTLVCGLLLVWCSTHGAPMQACTCCPGCSPSTPGAPSMSTCSRSV